MTSRRHFGETYGENAAENYERFFVPSIGEPFARDLLDVAALRPGERVLDVACGTGVVTRLAAERVGAGGAVAGLDVTPGMLAVARAVTRTKTPIEWHTASAEAMPLPDDAFDVVVCQFGLQFVPDKVAALREMRRVLAPGGRLALNLPGPISRVFAVVVEALARHIGPDAAAFVRAAFALQDPEEVESLLDRAEFTEVVVRRGTKTLRLTPAGDFLWRYISGTPLASLVGEADDQRHAALEREVLEGWQPFIQNDTLILEQGVVVATGRK